MPSTKLLWPMPTLAACCLLPALASAGPPYTTDDPEPVPYRHWELYLASQDEITSDGAMGTAPHVEVNYGAVPNLQLHVLVPLAYTRSGSGPTYYGPGDLELGAKYRFVQEGDRVPMVGAFPVVQVPTGNASRGLGTGHLHAFLPIWVQKSFGPWTTYGGGGYWINPGRGNRSFWLVGWMVQRRVAKAFTPGGEIFYTTPDTTGGRGNLRFDVGGIVDVTEHHHILFSAGRSIAGDSRLWSYLAYQLTL